MMSRAMQPVAAPSARMNLTRTPCTQFLWATRLGRLARSGTHPAAPLLPVFEPNLIHSNQRQLRLR